MFLIIILLFVVVVFPAVIFWFDIISDFYNGLKRYHIGQWANFREWENEVAKKAVAWSGHSPNVRDSDKSCYQLLHVISGKYRNKTIQSWQEGMLAMGLLEYDRKNGIGYNEHCLQNKYISVNGQWKNQIDRVDFALLAYAILKSCNDPKIIAPAMDTMISVIENNLCKDGMISYSQGKKSDLRYVDTLGMVCPFLALYGVTYNKSQYIDLAIHQIEKFRTFGILEQCSLPCHAYDVKASLPVGIYGWGRGTAWYLLALIDTWHELKLFGYKNDLLNWIVEAAENYINYQAADGGFSTILQGGGQYDSSVTAAMAYLYGICSIECNNKEYEVISLKCLEKLKSVTMKSGAVDCCQGDTHGIGIFSQVFDVMPFVQGLTLRALSLKTEDK